MTSTDNRSAEQAQAQLDSIRRLVARVEHAGECSGDADECELTYQEMYEGLGYWWQDGSELTEDDRASYHDEDSARQAINDDPLSVQVRSDWHSPGSEAEDGEYMILLCTGGPAVRIVGTLNQYGEPDSATIEHQDWITPWTEFDGDNDEAALLTYAAQFLGF